MVLAALRLIDFQTTNICTMLTQCPPERNDSAFNRPCKSMHDLQRLLFSGAVSQWRAVRGYWLAVILTIAPTAGLAAQLPAGALGAMNDSTRTTTVVILGVDHSAQLVGRAYHPGYFRAFFERVRPSALCVERSPDEFARNDYYEFTYEAQYVAVPYARRHGIDVCPVDWLPTQDDLRLAFGRLEVAEPPPVRAASGFQGFLAMDSSSLRRTLFFADSEAIRREARAFFDHVRVPGSRDFPRRLDLYRTYMQAMRVQAAARAHPGQVVVVVVGWMHKDDLELVLSKDPLIRIVQPSSFGPITEPIADNALTHGDEAAIASFNLLGVQSTLGPVDLDWVAIVLERLERAFGKTTETRLLRTRYSVLARHIDAAQAAREYEHIVQDADTAARFIFTGVGDHQRVDSYYDPFGNLTVRQRAQVEEAREWVRAGRPAEAQRLRADIEHAARWGRLAHAEFDAYWTSYIAMEPHS